MRTISSCPQSWSEAIRPSCQNRLVIIFIFCDFGRMGLMGSIKFEVINSVAFDLFMRTPTNSHQKKCRKPMVPMNWVGPDEGVLSCESPTYATALTIEVPFDASAFPLAC
jgi:hypothetical protein